MKVLAIIPCYDEEGTVGTVVRQTAQYVDTVMVIDNRSENGTLDEAYKSGADIINICVTRGTGISTRTGLHWLKSKHADHDVVVTLDGDGQHDPDCLPRLLQSIEMGLADIVIGSRFMVNNYSGPTYRKIGISLITWLYNIGSKKKVRDAQSCYRAFTREVAQSIDLKEEGFGFSTEFLIKTRKNGFRIAEIPIPCIYHDRFKDNSTLNPIIHGIDVATKTIKWRLWEIFSK